MSRDEAWVWATLGIAATSDQIAIKRAYAAALKRRRPEDDVDAYQALRAAFEVAVEAARHAAVTDGVAAPLAVPPRVVEALHIATPADADAPAPPPHPHGHDSDASAAHADPASSPLPVATPDAPRVHADADIHDHGHELENGRAQAHDSERETPTPEFLARSLHAYWASSGDVAVVELWPRVRHELDQLPLHQRDDASTWFASLVLEFRAFPGPVVLALADYFSWGRDFRVDQHLGPERAKAMRERLLELGGLRSTDPRQLRRFRTALRISALFDGERFVRARLLSLTASPRVLERLVETPPEQLGRLGLGGPTLAWVREAVKGAGVVHLGLVSAIAALIAYARGTEGALAVMFGSLGLLIGFVLLSVAMFWSSVLDRVVVELPTLWHRIVRLGIPRRFAAAGLLCAAAALAEALLRDAGEHRLWIILAVSTGYVMALLTCWNVTARHRLLIVPTALLCWAALAHLTPLPLPALVVAGVGVMWTLAAQFAVETRGAMLLPIWRAPLVPPHDFESASSPLARIAWWLSLPALALVALPAIMLIQAWRFGVFAALTCVIATLLALQQWGADAIGAGASLVLVPVSFWATLAGLEWIGRARWFDPPPRR